MSTFLLVAVYPARDKTNSNRSYMGAWARHDLLLYRLSSVQLLIGQQAEQL